MIVRARDVYGEPLPNPCTIYFSRLGSSVRGHHKVARDVPPNGRAEFSVAQQQTYRVRVVCEGHAEVARNVGGSIAEVDLLVPVDPSAVVGYDLPDPFPDIPGMPEDWRSIFIEDPRRIGTVLNIWAKLWATPLGLAPAATYIEELLEVRPDRIICRVSRAMAAALAASPDLDVVTSAVGHDPPPGYDNGPSYKTRDDHGNLQVSLFEPSASIRLGEMLADIDVDEERGFVHAFRAIGHTITGAKTDPVEVQQILAAQGIDAGWRPLLA